MSFKTKSKVIAESPAPEPIRRPPSEARLAACRLEYSTHAFHNGNFCPGRGAAASSTAVTQSARQWIAFLGSFPCGPPRRGHE
jgi:hypothetical protein